VALLAFAGAFLLSRRTRRGGDGHRARPGEPTFSATVPR
jgi:hypothetical protein